MGCVFMSSPQRCKNNCQESRVSAHTVCPRLLLRPLVAGPRWASWNLGIFVCIKCSGIHRNLGVHISKVRSTNLDTWHPEWIQSMQQWGNERANLLWEYHLNTPRPGGDDLQKLEQFIRNK